MSIETNTGSTAEDIKKILISNNLGVDPKDNPNAPWGINVQQQPDAPDECITLNDYSFKAPEQAMNKEQCIAELDFDGEVEYEGLQLRVRSSDYLTARNKLEQIRKYLSNTGNFDSEDGVYEYSVLQKTGVIPLGEDEGNNRQVLSVSFMATRTKY